jgi:hypothetical protein
MTNLVVRELEGLDEIDAVLHNYDKGFQQHRIGAFDVESFDLFLIFGIFGKERVLGELECSDEGQGM